MDMRTRNKKIQGRRATVWNCQLAVNHVYKNSRGLVWLLPWSWMCMIQASSCFWICFICEAKRKFYCTLRKIGRRNILVSTSGKVIQGMSNFNGKGISLLIRGLQWWGRCRSNDFNQRSNQAGTQWNHCDWWLWVNIFAPDRLAIIKILPNVMFTRSFVVW